MTIVSKDSFQQMLDKAEASDPHLLVHILGRALVVLFKRQTVAERQVNTVNVDNGIGFTGADGKSGCIGAKYYIKHGSLPDWVIDKWMARNPKNVYRIVKYHKQLNEAAVERKMAA